MYLQRTVPLSVTGGVYTRGRSRLVKCLVKVMCRHPYGVKQKMWRITIGVEAQAWQYMDLLNLVNVSLGFMHVSNIHVSSVGLTDLACHSDHDLLSSFLIWSQSETPHRSYRRL
jgi:hypothetical protein